MAIVDALLDDSKDDGTNGQCQNKTQTQTLK